MGADDSPGLEREFKFLLEPIQYETLWSRLRTRAKLRLQENLFFDRDGLLRRIHWALRLRLEREPDLAHVVDAFSKPPDLNELNWRAARALVTLKGPVLSVEQGVQRPEIEEEISVVTAEAAKGPGRLLCEHIPQRILHTLRGLLSDGQHLPDAFIQFISFSNLRLSWEANRSNNAIEVALDKSQRSDGRMRYELEVEWNGTDERAVREILAHLETELYQPTTRGKLTWAVGDDF